MAACMPFTDSTVSTNPVGLRVANHLSSSAVSTTVAGRARAAKVVSAVAILPEQLCLSAEA